MRTEYVSRLMAAAVFSSYLACYSRKIAMDARRGAARTERFSGGSHHAQIEVYIRYTFFVFQNLKLLSPS